VGGVNNMNFDLMEFTGLSVGTDTPYVSIGHWSFASPDHGVMGFPVSITNIGLATGTRGGGGFGVGLAMNFAVNLSDALSGNAGLTVWGKLSMSGAEHFSFDGVDLDSIGLHADMGAVDVTGTISFYHNDATYGDGFRGAIDAKFLKSLEVKATAQFGSVSGYRYWYVDAAAIFPDPGIIMSPGLAFFGFGGGAWYHMKKSSNELPPPTANSTAAPNPGATASGFTFTPACVNHHRGHARKVRVQRRRGARHAIYQQRYRRDDPVGQGLDDDRRGHPRQYDHRGRDDRL
jgi:hypothetical protein